MSDQPSKSDGVGIAAAIGEAAGKAAVGGASMGASAMSIFARELNDGKSIKSKVAPQEKSEESKAAGDNKANNPSAEASMTANVAGKVVAEAATAAMFSLGKQLSDSKNIISKDDATTVNKNSFDTIDGAHKQLDNLNHKLEEIVKRDYFLAKEGTTKLSTGDKLISLNGSQVLVAKDGSTITANKDGSIDVDSKETVKIKTEDGKTTLSYPNGDSVVVKGNSIQSVTRDGRTAVSRDDSADKIWSWPVDMNPPVIQKLLKPNADALFPAKPSVQEQMPALKPIYSHEN